MKVTDRIYHSEHCCFAVSELVPVALPLISMRTECFAFSEDSSSEEEPLDSSESSTFAAQQTKVLPSGMSRILSWYDNEWGFSNRMADTAVAMGAFL